jgi:hypothetical protein
MHHGFESFPMQSEQFLHRWLVAAGRTLQKLLIRLVPASYRHPYPY